MTRRNFLIDSAFPQRDDPVTVTINGRISIGPLGRHIVLSGTLWLDFQDETDESRYEARVERAIVRDREILLQFKGSHPDDGAFTGQCELSQRGAFFVGDGFFLCGGKQYNAVVSATLRRTSGGAELTGTWQDVGDPDPYVLNVDLEDAAGGS
jgi:hypothetical protein